MTRLRPNCRDGTGGGGKLPADSYKRTADPTRERVSREDRAGSAVGRAESTKEVGSSGPRAVQPAGHTSGARLLPVALVRRGRRGTARHAEKREREGGSLAWRKGTRTVGCVSPPRIQLWSMHSKQDAAEPERCDAVNVTESGGASPGGTVDDEDHLTQERRERKRDRKGCEVHNTTLSRCRALGAPARGGREPAESYRFRLTCRPRARSGSGQSPCHLLLTRLFPAGRVPHFRVPLPRPEVSRRSGDELGWAAGPRKSGPPRTSPCSPLAPSGASGQEGIRGGIHDPDTWEPASEEMVPPCLPCAGVPGQASQIRGAVLNASAGSPALQLPEGVRTGPQGPGSLPAGPAALTTLPVSPPAPDWLPCRDWSIS